LLGQSKFEVLTVFRDINQEGVDPVLVKVTHYNWPVEDAYTGFRYIRATASVVRNQRVEIIKYFKVLDRLRIC
jgi:hypothetical protein